ncbi:MFS transporter [Gloeobacter morelensis]|uniref:MFS transporter n=1 Tax=Gloeobacter morelensis MG652769 TaxID=2781736 RepID=A0ABY3PPP0_9CYAN|nr:MFS transporter [Gloeobacter morelensis]UFP95616.1 MFS transporter [Gloeobacter morelensis MG652769]
MAPTTQDSSQQHKTLGFRDVLRNRNFLFLWSGQVFSQLADKIFLVYMIALIAVHFAEALTAQLSSGIMIASSVPAILFGSVAGVYVDRWPKKTVLIVSNLLRGLFVLAVPFLPVQYAFWLAITFLVSTLTQFFAPAETAAIPLIIERRGLLSANSLFTATMMVAAVVGFAIGEPLLSLIGGADDGHWIVGGAYVIASLLIGFMHTGEKDTLKHRPEPNLAKDLREGFVYLKQNAGVRFAFVQLIVLYSVIAALTILAINLAPAIGLKQEQFGFLLASASGGLVAGAIAVGKFGNRLPRPSLALVGAILMGAALIGLYWASSVWLALALTLLLGLGGACIGVPMQTLIQEQTPEQMRGKVFGLQNNLVNIALSLPLVLAERAAALFGLRPVILALGLVVLLAGFVSKWFSRDLSK